MGLVRDISVGIEGEFGVSCCAAAGKDVASVRGWVIRPWFRGGKLSRKSYWRKIGMRVISDSDCRGCSGNRFL
jgi:hypothetical protein